MKFNEFEKSAKYRVAERNEMTEEQLDEIQLTDEDKKQIIKQENEKA